MERQTLPELMQRLDSEFGSIGSKVITLNDIEHQFSHFVQEMNINEHRKDLNLFINLHYREIRVLSELMSYIVNDLNKNFESAFDIQQSIFEKIIKKGESEAV